MSAAAVHVSVPVGTALDASEVESKQAAGRAVVTASPSPKTEALYKTHRPFRSRRADRIPGLATPPKSAPSQRNLLLLKAARSLPGGAAPPVTCLELGAHWLALAPPRREKLSARLRPHSSPLPAKALLTSHHLSEAGSQWSAGAGARTRRSSAG